MRIVIYFLLFVIAGFLLYQVLFISPEGSAEGTREMFVENSQMSIDSQSKIMSSREINISKKIVLPVPGSAPTENVKHSVPLEEIRLGCPRQDCIPSIQNPEFITPTEAADLLPADAIGIALSYKGEERFYPFPMLETRELVNDVVAGDPLLISYCPLCGTGIVFDRTVDTEVFEFGVSGMLWQSNLLMYNRADEIQDRNLWSQVLGEAVVGKQTGINLSVVTSDISRFSDWKTTHKEGVVLNSGSVRDPYNGEYFKVASRFGPNFSLADSPLEPMEYVYGIEIDAVFKAYPRVLLPVGETTDTVNGKQIMIVVSDSGQVVFTQENEVVPDVEGFWFSWSAAHPETLLWQGQ